MLEYLSRYISLCLSPPLIPLDFFSVSLDLFVMLNVVVSYHRYRCKDIIQCRKFWHMVVPCALYFMKTCFYTTMIYFPEVYNSASLLIFFLLKFFLQFFLKLFMKIYTQTWKCGIGATLN